MAFWPVWLIRIVVMPGSLFTHVPEYHGRLVRAVMLWGYSVTTIPFANAQPAQQTGRLLAFEEVLPRNGFAGDFASLGRDNERLRRSGFGRGG